MLGTVIILLLLWATTSCSLITARTLTVALIIFLVPITRGSGRFRMMFEVIRAVTAIDKLFIHVEVVMISVGRITPQVNIGWRWWPFLAFKLQTPFKDVGFTMVFGIIVFAGLVLQEVLTTLPPESCKLLAVSFLVVVEPVGLVDVSDSLHLPIILGSSCNDDEQSNDV